MTAFILSALFITALSLGLMMRPLFNAKDSDAVQRREHNILFARERLAELEEQMDSGSIFESDYAELKAEIEKNLADDLDLNEGDSKQLANKSDKSNTPLIILLSLILPIAG